MGDPDTKTYRVRFALPDDSPLMIGMTVEVNVVTATRPDTLLVPAGAVTADGAVFVVEDGRAWRRDVAIGIRGTTRIEILDGLDEGASVVVPPPDGLDDGARVVAEPAS
jgi:multidrug efflux pump subunit AcrA (membrane-fusion protein)